MIIISVVNIKFKNKPNKTIKLLTKANETAIYQKEKPTQK